MRNQPEAHTRLHGPALVLLRVIWIVLVGLTLEVFVVSIPARFNQLLTITPTGDNALVMLAPAEAAALAQHGIPLAVYASYFIVVETVFVAVYTVLGIAIFWRRSAEWWAAFMSLALIAFGVLVPATARVLDTPGSPWELLVHVVQNLGWVSFAISFYLFPDGRFVPRGSRMMLVAFLIWAAAWFVFPQANPFNWQLWQALLGFLVLFASGVLAQLYRYVFVSTPAQRLQTKWVVLAFGIATLGIVLFLAPQVVYPSTREPGWDRVVYHILGIAVFASSLLGIPISIDIAIRRYRLWEIDPIINRALVYGVLTLLLDELARFTGADWEQEDDVTLVTLEREAARVPGQSSLSSLGAQSGEWGGGEVWCTLAEFNSSSQEGNERVAMNQVAAAVEPLGLPPNRVEQLKTAVAEATMNPSRS